MAGLLNAGGFSDPLTMGLLGASQALLTHPSQGGGLGAAFAAFPAAQQAAEQRRMRELMLQAQMENQQAEANYRNSQIAASQEEARRKAQLEAQRAALFGEIAGQSMPSFRDVSAAITGVNPTADYVAPQDRKLNLTPQFAARAAALGIKPSELNDVFNAGRMEVARTIESAGPNGMPQTLQLDKYGGRIGGGIDKPVELRSVDLGNQVVSQNPYQSFALTKGLTPDAVASNAIARDRLNFDMKGKPQYDPERGILIDPTTNTATPVTMNGQPIGGKPKEPNEGQANAYLYASRASEANRIIDGLGNKPNVTGASIAQSVESMPLIGGAAGSVANWMSSKETQQYLQAQRDFINAVLRRESGAAIGQSEFDNARRQYFPQPGDSDAVKQQKAENRARAIAGISAGAGPLESRINQDPPQAAPASLPSAAPRVQTGLGTQTVSGPVGGQKSQYQQRDLEYTAKKHGISVEEVVNRLNQKR